MKSVSHTADLCVVGGGLAGMCAAIAAARHGSRVVLMHDRPVLGGNASSEIRMWICGAHGGNMRETGLVDEILLENMYRNPQRNYSIWDSVLYEKCRFQENLTLLLNCSCNKVTMDGDRIASVTGWQLTTETHHTVQAPLFADCSGDGILAPLSGAEFRAGREARAEFDENAGQEKSDARTMGMSCLIQARETSKPQSFTPPEWAYKYESCDQLAYRPHAIGKQNFWWIELGGARDSIHDTEEVRDELLKVAFGVWDHVKNHCTQQDASNWILDWVGFLPGKRESRRYLGDHVLTQRDVESEGRFDDIVAYGGWTMDDHPPGGMNHPGPPTVHHKAPSPYGIPYRCLYSRNVTNLFCAGRNMSCTHMAMSSTRVMATCATIGQAVGVAAALGHKHDSDPRTIHDLHLNELQQSLMDDDCYLPWRTRAIPDASRTAILRASEGEAETARSGVDRTVGADANCWEGVPGAWIEYRLPARTRLSQARIVFDSNLDSRAAGRLGCCYPLDAPTLVPPPQLVRSFRVEILEEADTWRVLHETAENRRRLVRLPIDVETAGVRLVPTATWGSEKARVFAFDVR